MRKPEILMLGWEFPPKITGGLGVASYHIVRSLSKQFPLTLILPNASPRVRIQGVRMIDAGRFDPEKLFSKREWSAIRARFSQAVHRMLVSPYPVKSPGEKTGVKSLRRRKPGVKSNGAGNILSGAELYGDDVIEKVNFFAAVCKKLAGKINFDIIHAHDWMTFPAALAVREMSGKPLVIHIHSLNTDRIGPGDQGWIYQLEKETLSRADLILPVSNYTGNMIRHHYGIRKNKIFPVHNGVRKTKVFRTPKKFPEKLVLFLGRITYQKGPEYFLDVATRLARNRRDIRFVIAGGGDKFIRMIEEGAYRELGGRLHFTGNIDRRKVREVLSMADVFVMPSVSEPFGLVALEAAQFGVPVIISRHSGAAEVLTGAIKVDFWDIDNMENSIVKLTSDPKFIKKVVDQQHADLELLTWEKTAALIAKGYSRIFKG
jgi:glycosyltransferase involved in cell wall biosynthesis